MNAHRQVISGVRSSIVAAAIIACCWSGNEALAQSVIDMPPPRHVSAQSETTEADTAATSAMADLGQLAFNRYGHQRTGATNIYGMYNRTYRGGWPYGYGYRGWYGWGGWGWGYPCYGGASVVYVGGGRFVGTLCN